MYASQVRIVKCRFHVDTTKKIKRKIPISIHFFCLSDVQSSCTSEKPLPIPNQNGWLRKVLQECALHFAALINIIQ